MTNVISRQCNALRSALGKPDQAFKEVVHPYMLQHFARQFDTAGGHGGRPWAELEPLYAESQQSLGDSLIPLRADWPVLEPSLTQQGKSHVFITRGNSVQIGSMVPYARKVADGGVGPFGETFPGRDPRVMTRGQVAELGRNIQKFFMRGVR
jgi:hypothetical protein